MTGRLVFIGLGLWDEQDITVKGLNEARSCKTIYAELYTSRLFGTTKKKLEELIGKPIIVLSREIVEKEDEIIESARNDPVAFLTGGDPMVATTHLSLRLRAAREGIPTSIIHGNSIVTAAAGVTGLQIYKFGRITTLVRPQKNYSPDSFYDAISDNKTRGLHSLILLDIDAEHDSYMCAPEGIKILQRIEGYKQKRVVDTQTVLVVIARASSPLMKVKAGYPPQLLEEDFGPPLHTLIIPGSLHPLEARALIELADAPSDILHTF